MNSKKQKAIAAVTLAALLVVSTMPVLANDDISSLNQQKNVLQNEKNEIKQQLNNTVIEKNKTLTELEKINRQLNTVQNDLAAINTEIAETEEKITFTVTEIDNKQRDYEGRMLIFSQRLVDMYEYGDVSFLEVLLQASDLRDFLTRFEYLKYIAGNDQKMLDEVIALKDKLEEEKVSLETMKSTLEVKQKEQLAKSAELETASNQKEAVVAEINAQQDTYYDMLDAIEEESRQIAAEIQRIQAASSGTSKAPGAYLWPCPSSGRITSKYGYRIHPISGVKKLHSGTDIAASYGADVIAAAGGTVIKSEYYGGYGNCIIIDHGGGMSTLYGHMSSLVAKNGDTVAAGQVIGKVGSTGASTGNHLHFEVRINGATTEPTNYVSY